MLKIERDVKEFHLCGGVGGLAEPGFPGQDRIELRKKLIREEVGETLDAIDEGDLIEVADGIADSIVVLVGTALEFGIDLTAVWEEVHRSNMSKFPTCATCEGRRRIFDDSHDMTGEPCGTCGGKGRIVLKREDGKILKPDSWSPPDIALVLENQRKP